MEHLKNKKSGTSSHISEKNQIYRLLPRVDELMKKEKVQKLVEREGYERVLHAVRESVDHLRNEITEEIRGGMKEENGGENHEKAVKEKIQNFLHLIETGEEHELSEPAPENRNERKRNNLNIYQMLEKEKKKEIHPVYNGTGVILHTGLGRAPLGHETAEKLKQAAENYSSLEYDLNTGKRGSRTGYVEEILCQLTGAEAALAVNNNAGAVLLVLSALTRGGEVIVSRGELVEIGGKFRIPEVLELSGARLREVGTTNRTRIDDYERAVCAETKAFLKVHTSNYRIIGFTESVSAGQLKELSLKLSDESLAERSSARNRMEKNAAIPGAEESAETFVKSEKIPVIEDLGSGVLVNLEAYGLPKEPTVQDEVKAGADIVCFSGDKLLGGAQAGLIVGKKAYIDRMRNHPLLRALRADKFTLTALESVLKEYLDLEQAVSRIPVLKMLTCPQEEIKEKAVRCCNRLDQTEAAVEIRIESLSSRAGGGALPDTEIPSFGVSLLPEKIRVEELEERMRSLPVPVIGRIQEGRFVLDMRTFAEEGIEYLAEVLPEVVRE